MMFLVCRDKGGYETSLVVAKIYRKIRDTKATNHRMVRVVDETGDDYLFPADLFTSPRSSK